MGSNGSVSGGSTYASNFFTANLPSAYSGLTPTVSVTKTGTTITATVSFTTTVPTYFMGIVGYPNVTISDSSTASYTFSSYLNFYLMIDVSGSMSFPSTPSEQTRLMAVNPDNLGQYPNGCQFACHFTAQNGCGQSNQGPTPAVGIVTAATCRTPARADIAKDSSFRAWARRPRPLQAAQPIRPTEAT